MGWPSRAGLASIVLHTAVAVWAAGVAACGGGSPTSPSTVPVTPGPPSPSNPGGPTTVPSPSTPGAPTLGITNLLCFGDSMTSGYVAPSTQALVKAVADAYPTRLQVLLEERYRNQTFTITNAGKVGEWAEDGVARLVPLVRASRPGAVVLLEGANDLDALGSGGAVTALEALEDMLRDARALGARVLLASLPPQRPERGNTAFIAELNLGIARLAQRQQVLFVDVHRAFGGDLTLIGADGLHPTAAGYSRIAQAVFEVLRVNFEQAAPAAPTRLQFTRASVSPVSSRARASASSAVVTAPSS